MFDHPSRSIWSVSERKVVDDVLTGDVPLREVRNKKRHFTVRRASLPFPIWLRVLALQYSKVCSSELRRG